VFEFKTDVEVVFNGGFAAAGHHDDVGDTGVDRFFDAVLNNGLVDERQHLFGLRFRGREEAGSETGGGENGFANFRGGHSLLS